MKKTLRLHLKNNKKQNTANNKKVWQKLLLKDNK